MDTEQKEAKELIKKDPYIALRFPEFRYFIGMRFCITFALQIKAVIIGWFLYSLTKDPLSLGLVGLAEAIPAISIALYGGHVADNSDKKKLLIIVLSVILTAAMTLFIFTNSHVMNHFSKSTIVWVIYSMVFLDGLARGFFAPAAFSLMAFLVPKEHYPNSSAWNSSSWQLAAVLGPAAGGLLYGWFGMTATLSVSIVFVVLAFIFISLIKNRPALERKATEKITDSLFEGVRFVFGNKMILGAMALDMFSVFFGGAVALLPIFANDILKVGAEGLGFLRAAPAAGAVITMLLMTRRTPATHPWRNLLLAITGFGISTVLFALSSNFYLSLLFLFLTGAFDSVSVVIRSTIFQLMTPDHMRGRVSAVNTMFIGSSNEIGAFESGLTAKLMGTIPAVIFGGIMTLLIAGITFGKTRNLIGVRLVGKEIK